MAQNEAVCTINEKGVILTVNGPFSRIFGYRTTEIVGQNISKIIPEPFKSNHDAYLEKFLEKGAEQSAIIDRSREVMAMRKDGTPISIQIQVTIQSRGPGNTYVFCGRMLDLSATRSLDKWMKKSAFEQYLFGMLYALTQGNKAPKHTISLLALSIDFLSILSFNFRGNFPWGPGIRQALSYVLSFASAPLFEASRTNGYTVVRTIWAVVVAFLLVAFIDIGYVAWAFRANHVRFVAAVKLLRVVVSYVVTTFFVTLLGVLLFPLDCTIIGQSSPSLSMFPEIECWGASNGPVAAVSLIVAILFALLAWCTAYMPRDPHPSSENILASSNSYFDVISVFLRTLQSCVITFLSGHEPVIGAVNFTCSCVYLVSFLYFSPHFRPWMNQLRTGIFTCVLWSSMCLVGVISQNNPTDEMYTYIFTAGAIPSFGVGYLLCKIRAWWVEHKWRAMSTPPSQRTGKCPFSSKSSAHPHAEGSTTNGAAGGCPVIHAQPSPNAQPPPQPQFRRRGKQKEAMKFSNELEVELLVHCMVASVMEDRCDDPAAMLARVRDVLLAGISQFPRSGSLLVTHAIFSKEVDFDLVSSVENFERAKSMTTTMPLRFIMYSHFKDEENRYRSAEAGEAGLGIVELVELRKDQQLARKHHLHAVKNIKQMWRALLPDKVDVSVLPDIMQRIYVHQSKADSLFEKMLEKYKESPRMLRCYAMYLHDVKNDSSASNAYYKMADEVEERNSKVEHKEEVVVASPVVEAQHAAANKTAAPPQQEGSVYEMSVTGTNFSTSSQPSRFKRRKVKAKSQDPVFRLHVKIVLLLICVFVFILTAFITTQIILGSLGPLLTRMHEGGELLAQSQRIAYASQFVPGALPPVNQSESCPVTLTRSFAEATEDLVTMQRTHREHLLSRDHLSYGPLQDFLYTPSIPFCYQDNSDPGCRRNFIETVQDWELAGETIFTQNVSQCIGCSYLTTYGPSLMFEAVKTFGQLQRELAEMTAEKAFLILASAQSVSICVLVLVVVFIIHPSVRASCAGYFHTYQILLKIPKDHVEGRLLMTFHVLNDPESDDAAEQDGDLYDDVDQLRKESKEQKQKRESAKGGNGEEPDEIDDEECEESPSPQGDGEFRAVESYRSFVPTMTPDMDALQSFEQEYQSGQLQYWGENAAMQGQPNEAWDVATYFAQQQEYFDQAYQQQMAYGPGMEMMPIGMPGGYQGLVSPMAPQCDKDCEEVAVDIDGSDGDTANSPHYIVNPSNYSSAAAEFGFSTSWSCSNLETPIYKSSSVSSFEQPPSVDLEARPSPPPKILRHSSRRSSGQDVPITPSSVAFSFDPDFVKPSFLPPLPPVPPLQDGPMASTPAVHPGFSTQTAKEPKRAASGSSSGSTQQQRSRSKKGLGNSTRSMLRMLSANALFSRDKKKKSKSESPERKRVRELSSKYFIITFIIVWLLIGSMIMFRLATDEIVERQHEITLASVRQGVAERLRFFVRWFSVTWLSSDAERVSSDLDQLISIHRYLLYGDKSHHVESNLFRLQGRFDLYFGCSTPTCVGLSSLFQKLVSQIYAFQSTAASDLFTYFCSIESSTFDAVLRLLRKDDDLILGEAQDAVARASSQQGIMLAIATLALFAMHVLVFWPLVRVMRTEEHMMRMMLLMLPSSLVEKVPEIKTFLLSKI